MNNENICKQCLLKEQKPYIFFDNYGVCNVCNNRLERKQQLKDPVLLESDLIKLLDKTKGKNKYDCLVMCSGGKDSTAALYFMKKRYKLNVLAFMFDHGFESTEAISNFNNAVNILNVDYIFYKSSFMHPMFKQIIESNSKAVLCHVCSIWYMGVAYDFAANYNIPLIVAGWTRGQYSKNIKGEKNIHNLEFLSMAKSTSDFLKNNLKDYYQYKNFPDSMDVVIKRAQKRHKSQVISPHWFLPYSVSEYVQIIENELNWKMPKISYPAGSTNCSLNFISVYNSLKHYGCSHYHIEASKLIREGQLTRDEAIEQLKINFDTKLLNDVAAKLNIDFTKYL